MFSKVAAATAAGALAVSGLATGTAHASTGWQAKAPSKILDSGTVRLEGGNTSVETSALDMPVQAGDVVSFRYRLRDGATCTGGAPRVFVETQGTYTNSWDQNIGAGKQCGENGVVTFTVPANGRIGAAGIVYDNGGPGHVIVSDLTVDGRKVRFLDRRPAPAAVPVKPRQPWVDQPKCGTNLGWVGIPRQRGVSFKIDGRPMEPGRHEVRPGRYVVTAHAWDGHKLVGEHAWKRFVKRGLPCGSGRVATPVEPTLDQPTCADKVASLAIPKARGVIYRTAPDALLEQGRRYTVDAGLVVVTAEAAHGFKLAEGAQREWRMPVAEKPDCRPANPPATDVDVVNDIPVPTRVDTGLGGLAR
ncbi:hypothetical protein [Nonomuraea maritima]|uniref:hypothetical protein n=1 Tax=Nonomuraea maritima TaxID=683260 RepID=UPI00371895E8